MLFQLYFNFCQIFSLLLCDQNCYTFVTHSARSSELHELPPDRNLDSTFPQVRHYWNNCVMIPCELTVSLYFCRIACLPLVLYLKRKNPVWYVAQNSLYYKVQCNLLKKLPVDICTLHFLMNLLINLLIIMFVTNWCHFELIPSCATILFNGNGE